MCIRDRLIVANTGIPKERPTDFEVGKLERDNTRIKPATKPQNKPNKIAPIATNFFKLEPLVGTTACSITRILSFEMCIRDSPYCGHVRAWA